MLETVNAMLVIGLLATSAGAADNPGNGIKWIYSFDEAAKLARQTGRHLVVDFITPT